MPVISSITSSTATCELKLGGAPLELRVNKRARRLRLRLDSRTGGLTLTIPAGVSKRRALEWAAQHEEWAARAIGSLPERAALGPGAAMPLFGRPHVVDWDAGRPRRITLEGGRIMAGGPLEGLERRLLRWLKREALAVLAAETQEHADLIGREAVPVSVGDPRSRWGSCSSSGAIRYSWRLVLAPDFVRRATVAHEVAHLVHMDHGPRFHALAERLFGGDPKPARLWLRREGAALHRIGGGSGAVP
jgi:predicted metal-dependent hydrolase